MVDFCSRWLHSRILGATSFTHIQGLHSHAVCCCIVIDTRSLLLHSYCSLLVSFLLCILFMVGAMLARKQQQNRYTLWYDRPKYHKCELVVAIRCYCSDCWNTPQIPSVNNFKEVEPVRYLLIPLSIICNTTRGSVRKIINVDYHTIIDRTTR